MAKKPTSPAPKSQRDTFIGAARELGCDDDPAHFDEVLKKVARHKREAGMPPGDIAEVSDNEKYKK